jgi:transcriptional regulator with XRE-family HTH domain
MFSGQLHYTEIRKLPQLQDIDGEEIMYTKYAKLRDKRKLTDFAVCKATGIAPSTMSDWKHGRCTPKYDKTKKIAELFGISVEELMG